MRCQDVIFVSGTKQNVKVLIMINGVLCCIVSGNLYYLKGISLAHNELDDKYSEIYDKTFVVRHMKAKL